MKILLASDVYKYTMNGAASIVITLADALRGHGHDVKVITMSDSKKSFRQGDDYFISSYQTLLYPGFRQTFVRRHPYLEELKEWKPDVIHLHTEGSAAGFARDISKATGAPIIITMHTDYAQYAFHGLSKTPPVKGLFRILAAYFYRGADMMTTPSKKAEALLRSYRYNRPECVIPNGIKLERFQKDYTAEERKILFARYGIPDNGKTFVCVSRLSLEKNLREVLDFFSALIKKDDEVRLLIAGNGPDMKNLQAYAERLGISGHVVFAGRILQDELYRYYKSGIAFLSASTFEMHSLTYLEALACGIPLICRDDPCLDGVLDNGINGFTYRTENEFLESCLRLIADPALRDEFAAESLRRSEAFSDINCARQMVQLYKRVIEATDQQ